MLLDLRYPIISAPMARSSGGILTPAVSNGGGLGTFGGVNPVTPIGSDYTSEQIGLVRDQTERPFGVGFITHLLGLDDRNFDHVLDENVPVVLFSFALALARQGQGERRDRDLPGAGPRRGAALRRRRRRRAGHSGQ